MFLNVNEKTEALNAVFMLKEFLTKVETVQYYLKWAILAAYDALLKFVLVSLKGCSHPKVLAWRSSCVQTNSLGYFDGDTQQMEYDRFFYLFKIAIAKDFCTNPVLLDQDEKIALSVSNLCDYRNQFTNQLAPFAITHVLQIYFMLADVLKFLSALTQDCSQVTRHYDEQELNNIRQTLAECTTIVNQHL